VDPAAERLAHASPGPGPPCCSGAVTPFGVRYATKPGQDLFVVGNVGDLGDWNEGRAMPLSYSSGDQWEGTVNLNNAQPLAAIEYKYILKEQGRTRWEEGANHYGAIGNNPAPVFNDAWHQGHMGW
jgi:hypothetical protein